jgi:surfeit locus 1 family protein
MRIFMATNPAVSSLQCSSRQPGRLRDARPVWLPTLAAVAFAIATAMLGQWQWHKAELKAALGDRHESAGRLPALSWSEAAALGESALYRRVRLDGRFAADYQILLDNRVQHGQAGYHVMAPMHLAQGGAVLVNRGWLPAGDRSRLPEAAVPAGGQRLEGILVHASSRYLELAPGSGTGRLWQNLDLDRYRAWFGDLPDWQVLQTAPAGDGLVRDWPVPDTGVAKHRSYAVQWFSMSALIVGLWLYFVVFKRLWPR